jgi:hypothetical protein
MPNPLDRALALPSTTRRAMPSLALGGIIPDPDEVRHDPEGIWLWLHLVTGEPGAFDNDATALRALYTRRHGDRPLADWLTDELEQMRKVPGGRPVTILAAFKRPLGQPQTYRRTLHVQVPTDIAGRALPKYIADRIARIEAQPTAEGVKISWGRRQPSGRAYGPRRQRQAA